MKAPLLIEIGVEELPPRAMRSLAETFATQLAEQLAAQGITHDAVHPFGTPRRLAAYIEDVASETPPVDVEKAGPTIAIAFDDAGEPTRAARGFASSVGTTVDALEREDSEKGERLVYRATEAGRDLDTLLQQAVDHSLRRLPIPKLMRWGDSDAAFVRPVHWLVALHGERVVPLNVLDQQADRDTRGHRFHHPAAITLDHADAYCQALEQTGYVLADMAVRKARIEHQVQEAGRGFGGEALVADDLVDEVTALVEWPVGLAGSFDTRYLQLPREVLISTLQEHQRYFPIEDDDGALMAGFITVANLESRDVAQVVAGNERVVHPRLADALFFWEQDRRRGLSALVDGLDRVSFQQSLGSMADKSARVALIAQRLTSAAGADSTDVARAATLAKADLLTEMVDEFPDLQGIMGYYYARDSGEPAAVAQALAEQYAPARAGAPIAASPTGRVLALADRLDTLAGIFAIDRRPSGDKDPFGLRRAALGVVRTVIESGLALDLRAEIDYAVSQQPFKPAADTASALWMFHMERLRHYYTDRGIAGDRFDAVSELALTDLVDFDRRVVALDDFAADTDAATVCGAHKRIRNILRRNAEDVPSAGFDSAGLVEAAEQQLATAMQTQRNAVTAAIAAAQPRRALDALAALARPLDRFFENVMVMTDDIEQRRNRLGLLASLDGLCREVADISRLSLD